MGPISNTTFQNSDSLPIVETTVLPEPASTDASPHPVYTAERIKTIDIIRGFALFGILLMNIPIFGDNQIGFFNALGLPHNSTDYRTLTVVYSFFDGTMRGLFSMLFGAGMILFTLNKKEKPGGVTIAEYYYRRLLWLVFFGMINAFVFLWEGDILFYYGLAGMMLYPFRKASAKWLIVLALVCFSVNLVKGAWGWSELREMRSKYKEATAAKKAKKKLTAEQEQAIGTWTNIESHQKPDTAEANKAIAEMQGNYFQVFKHLIPINSRSETWGSYEPIWDWLGMMFLGMALLGLGYFSGNLPASVYRLILLVGYGLGIPIGYIFFKNTYPNFLNFAGFVDNWRVPYWAAYDLRRVLLCFGHASLLILVFRSKLVPWLMKSLACVGQMAFTNYLVQSLVCTFFFFGYGFGYYHKLRFHQLYYVVGAVWIFQMIFSVIWLQYFRFGPFEWLWRSLTYWKKQPMLINKKTVSPQFNA
jgi:uncharacterized protein